jgi:hypothetical protein
MNQLIEHRLEVAEHNLEQYQDDPVRYWETEIRIQELKDILKELERVEIKPEPQPIEKLFELEEDTSVWVKSKLGVMRFGRYNSFSQTLVTDQGEFYSKDEITKYKTSFLIAEVPKF